MGYKAEDYGDMLIGIAVWFVSGILLIWLGGWAGLVVIVHVWGVQVLLRGRDTFEEAKRLRLSISQDDLGQEILDHPDRPLFNSNPQKHG